MNRNKTFPLGGILVESYRALTEKPPIRPLSLPSLAIVPLVQYASARAHWVVSVGDHIDEEQVLAKGLRPEDLDVHSPTPGVLQEFREITLPGGVVTSAALIRLDGQFRRTGKALAPRDWSDWSPQRLLEHIHASGAFLEASPLDQPVRLALSDAPVHDLIVNALQPEPYLTLPLKLLEERFSAVVEGIRILQRVYQPARTHLAADVDDFEAKRTLWAESLDGVQFHGLQFKFPQAQSGLLLKTLGAARDALILDVSAVLAIRDAVVEGRPQIEKTVVLSGHGARRPGTYRVRIGTPLFQFLRDAGGIHPDSEKILVGGPFLGALVEDLSSPVVKSTQAVLVLTRGEVNSGESRACIRCGSCVSACPVGLEPLNLFKLIRQDNRTQAREEGLEYCIECGVCAFVCPSRLPLVEVFQNAKVGASHG